MGTTEFNSAPPKKKNKKKNQTIAHVRELHKNGTTLALRNALHSKMSFPQSIV